MLIYPYNKEKIWLQLHKRGEREQTLGHFLIVYIFSSFQQLYIQLTLTTAAYSNLVSLVSFQKRLSSLTHLYYIQLYII